MLSKVALMEHDIELDFGIQGNVAEDREQTHRLRQWHRERERKRERDRDRGNYIKSDTDIETRTSVSNLQCCRFYRRNRGTATQRDVNTESDRQRNTRIKTTVINL